MPIRDDEVRAGLARAGLSEATAEAALEIDAVLQRWRRRVTKRELGQRALADLDLTIDLAQLDVLVAVYAPANEFGGEDDGETMVSTVAARLGIDPSRASRVTSELIRLGLVRRAVSQQDARRTILEVTEAGAAVVRAVRTYKFLMLGTFLQDWSSEEIATFLPLLERFSSWSEEAEAPAGPVAEEIAALRAALPVSHADTDTGE